MLGVDDGTRVVVRLDLFPARLFVAGTMFSPVRVVIADDQLLAYRLGGSGPEVAYQRTISGPLTGSVGVGVSVPVDEGEVWVESSGGCACGAALGNLDLFPGHQRVMIGLHG